MVEKADRCQDGISVELTIGYQPVISEAYCHEICSYTQEVSLVIWYESRGVDSAKSEGEQRAQK
jgi:hypothetical protein